MLFLFYIVLLMYVGLTLLYAVTPPESVKITPWPLLSLELPEALPSTCTAHADCPAYHLCLGGQCVPKLQRTEDCDPATGQWISYVYGGADVAVCVCTRPEVMGQRIFGGNCDVEVACGVHGRLVAGACQCDLGYEPVGFTCRKRPVASYLSAGPCESHEVEVASGPFHPEYRPATRCVRKPCTFDALTGKSLRHGRFEPGWGCVCDPRFGLFGVSLAGDGKQYLQTEGYDACALIFPEEPSEPRSVELYTYFYLGHRPPLSLIIFKNLPDLAPPFKGPSLVIGQKLWRYDYTQHFFKVNSTFRARQRYTWTVPKFEFVDYPIEWHYSPQFLPVFCDEVKKVWRKHKNPKVDAYRLLYWYPVCKMPASHPLFGDRMVVNPQQVTFKDFDHLRRYNAINLYYEAHLDRWTVDLQHYANEYLTIDNNAPHYPPDTSTKIGDFRYSGLGTFAH